MKKIVLIEDNEDVRENIAEILELANYEVKSAKNGKEGVAIVKSEIPDLVICDIMMPELDGYGVLHILSKSPETSSIPFIFLTAKAEKSDMRKGMNLGADDYLTKPFDETELLDAIEVRLKKSEIVKKDFSSDISGLNEFFDEARSNNGLEELSKDRQIKQYKKKEVVYREGDPAHFLYFIVKGKIKCTKTDEFGKELVTGIYSTGDFIGYLSLFHNTDRLETANTLEQTELAAIPKADFLALIQKNRDIANKFILMLASNVQEKQEQLLQFAYSPVRERVAAALYKLNQQQNSDSIQVSRDDLAAIVGTATETLIRTLSEFKQDKLITTEGRSIKVLDPEGIKRIYSF